MAHWEWTSDDIEWSDVLGSGSFGVVHRVRCGGLELAAKRLDVSSASHQKRQRKEVEELLGREFRALQAVAAGGCATVV